MGIILICNRIAMQGACAHVPVQLTVAFAWDPILHPYWLKSALSAQDALQGLIRAWNALRSNVLKQGKQRALMLKAIGHLTMRRAAQAWNCWLEYVQRQQLKHMVRLRHCSRTQKCPGPVQ